jgi:hypothetical protein
MENRTESNTRSRNEVISILKQLSMNSLPNDDYGMMVLGDSTAGDYRTFQEYLLSEEGRYSGTEEA